MMRRRKVERWSSNKPTMMLVAFADRACLAKYRILFHAAAPLIPSGHIANISTCETIGFSLDSVLFNECAGLLEF
jgi:hypothetical protein